MANINIEIPDDVHKKIKLASVIKEITLKNHIIKILEKRVKGAKDFTQVPPALPPGL